MKIYKIILFPAVIAVLTFAPGCSDAENAPEVKIKKNIQKLTGKIRCPKCWKILQQEEIIPEKAPLSRCKLCRKISPTVKFYPETKIKRKKR